MRSLILVAALSLTLAPGCTKSHPTPEKTAPSSTSTPKAAPQTAPSAATAAATQKPAKAKQATVELKLGSVKGQMKFDITKLTVKTGALVHLVFHNTGPVGLQHNWVLVKPGTNAKVALAGVQKKAAGYIASNDPDILAHTPLAFADKTVSVTFTAPAPGTWPYICTVPGHYLSMHGELVVTP